MLEIIEAALHRRERREAAEDQAHHEEIHPQVLRNLGRMVHGARRTAPEDGPRTRRAHWSGAEIPAIVARTER